MRYKVAYGGRGGSKSWGFARAILILGAKSKLRILCTRAVQRSIRDSVHKLLSDQIEALGLGHFYTINNTSIEGANGTEIMFCGLSNQTSESIKSYEGVKITWCEEANSITKHSWNTLIPTIRDPTSEIWVSFNPELDTDDTYRRFVINPPPDSVVAEINHSDNPWFPEVLEKERIHAKATMPKSEYENVWEGKCLPAVSGAIYATEMSEARTSGRVTNIPYDPNLKVHCIFDLGWNDKMSIILAQRHASALYVIEYIEDDHKTLDWYSSLLNERRYNWGRVWLPHDGHQHDYKSGMSAAEIMTNLGWRVDDIPQHAVEMGIRLARRGFPNTYFDKDKSAQLLNCLSRYRRSVPLSTGEPGAPVHDEWSHGADAFRYLHLVAPKMDNEDRWGEKLNYPSLGIT